MTSLNSRLAQLIGGIFALAGVVLGALAAHGPLHDLLAARNSLGFWQTALFQQWVHALTLLALGQGTTLRKGPLVCWTLGVIFFSGSLYLLAFDATQTWAGPVTPLGGLFLIAGWVWFLIGLGKKTA